MMEPSETDAVLDPNYDPALFSSMEMDDLSSEFLLENIPLQMDEVGSHQISKISDFVAILTFPAL